MTNLSTEAIYYLRTLLADEIERRVQSGWGEEPMPDEWTELYMLTLDLR